ncbi:MAG: cytochrome c [Nitrospirae bacterium]|nr:cytochrome c [Nitrospirota bacterium]
MKFMTVKIFIVIIALSMPAVLFAGEEKWAKSVPNDYIAMKNKFNGADKDILQRGESLYSKKCVQCHGEKGDAVGSICEGLPMPTFNKELFIKRQDGQLFWVVEQGVNDTLMPAFGPGSDMNISHDDIWKIIAYLRSRFGK